MREKIVIRSPETPEEFAQYYHIRWKTLREPWGQPEGSEKDEFEDETLHRAAFFNDKIVAVARIQKNSPQEAQIRYMGVLEEFRGHGIGRMLIESLEEAAVEKDFESIILNARENAVGFYVIMGYEVVCESYLLFDSIQHFKMKKVLFS